MSDTDMSDAVDEPSYDDKPCGCEECMAVEAANPLLAADIQVQKKKKKKRYTPPRADEDTFPTQQDFLNSLQSTSIQNLSEDDRKCVICRKPYGEPPDLGFDNSEEPVKLRCGHAFGDKCLQQLFALPTRTSLSLRPLCFEPSSRGFVLGHRLQAYVCEHAKHHGNITDTMIQLTKDIEKGDQGYEILGRHWRDALVRLLQFPYDLSAFWLLENGTVVDVWQSNETPSFKSFPVMKTTQLAHGSSNMDSTLYELTGMQELTEPPPPFSPIEAFPPITTTLSFGTESVGLFAQPETESSFAPKKPIGAGDLTLGSNMPKDDSTVDWKTALGDETKLDKLMAFKKNLNEAKKSKAELTEAEKQETLISKMSKDLSLKDTQKRLQKEVNRRTIARRNLLAQTLEEVYTSWRNSGASKKKPEKTDITLGLADVWINVHTFEDEHTSYDIDPPFRTYAPLDIDFSEDDDDYDEDEDAATSKLLKDTVFTIFRRACTLGCSRACQAQRRDMQGLPLIQSLSWRNTKEVPDACPLCHKVLFLKTKLRS